MQDMVAILTLCLSGALLVLLSMVVRGVENFASAIEERERAFGRGED